MSFLTAEWRKLLMFNYEVDPELLKPYVPYRTEIDFREGKTFVSLVGFRFLHTRLLGIPIPFHTNFDEVNLRFYVRYHDGGEWKRGVVFIKEIVPRAALTLVANTLYREHYETWPMKHDWQTEGDRRTVRYAWKYRGVWQSFSAEAEASARPIESGSEEEFITEHYWGYTKVNERKTYEYEVRHPQWEQYPVLQFQSEVDYGEVYGEDFRFLNWRSPSSVLLAEGSPISVEGKRSL